MGVLLLPRQNFGTRAYIEFIFKLTISSKNAALSNVEDTQIRLERQIRRLKGNMRSILPVNLGWALREEKVCSSLVMSSRFWLAPSAKVNKRAIKAAFTLSKKLSPCILFIGEVDALFSRRSSDDKPWRRQALTQYLQEMGGLAISENSPFVLGLMNKPLDLDEAFLRRMPFRVQFKLPGSMERRKILELSLKESDLDPSFDMDSLVQSTEGYSGSDLCSLCGQSAFKFGMDHVRCKADDNDQETISTTIQLKNHHFDEALRSLHLSVTFPSSEDTVAFNRLFDSEGP